MDIQNRKRKIDCDSNITESEIQSNKYNPASFNTGDLTSLQTILENDVFQGRVPASDVTSHLLKWFRVIVRDSEKLRTFRQWVFSSPDNVKQELDRPIECNSNNVVTIAPVPSSSSTSAPSSASSSASLSHLLTDDATSMDIAGSNMIVDKVPSESQARSMGGSSTGRFTPESTLINNSFKNSPSSAASNDQGLLHQLLQQQQQQIVLLQQLQRQPPSPQDQSLASQAATISISPKIGNAGTLVTVTLKGKPWHARTSQCSCSLGFTAANGNTSSSQRIPGGTEGDFLFMVPQINARTANTSLVVHFTLCTSPAVPIVCLDSFHYTLRERSLGGSTTSDEDSETASTGEDDVGSPPQAPSPVDSPNFVCPTPKQMMSIRERMLEHTQKGAHSSVRLTVIQQPTVRVVWKNRRLDVPFKLRIECTDDSNSLTPQKLVVLAVVADHKGRLQIDAAENYAEDGGSQGVVNFSNLRMTKGTWGKEWNITFAAVVKSSINNPVVVGVSTACPIVVKTRKNPQVRHGGRVESSPPKSPQFTFVVERKGSESPVPLKRHRVEDLLDSPPAPPPAQPARTMSHFDDMASLLAAAELKQQEMQEGHDEPADVPCLPAMKQNDNDHSFANFQNLVSYLDDIRQKRQVSLGILEQPPPKRDSKVLIVKKGKPFRTPFQLQLNSTALRHNPQNYVCVAVVRNDKGEEVAVRNNEVPFDWRGVACFAGLMVMKGTWGKAVQLTFEARWATKRDKNAPWASHTRVLVVSETSPTQLMCYTKDKKSPGAA